eukprot:CAMPEP_0118645632 /NCGR_PEP_ID=MMETSP0785-20121206/7609_1 /TAXON_ID=91992 /ORGANISM="Bolidomonas pacifica, Strain CCMP 1866" /LENGTH=209 /DNA_ID=CAMNT_0006537537 /DNA_START=504 /DNA_END=1134 /DNA_ORIENTATION=+
MGCRYHAKVHGTDKGGEGGGGGGGEELVVSEAIVHHRLTLRRPPINRQQSDHRHYVTTCDFVSVLYPIVVHQEAPPHWFEDEKVEMMEVRKEEGSWMDFEDEVRITDSTEGRTSDQGEPDLHSDQTAYIFSISPKPLLPSILSLHLSTISPSPISFAILMTFPSTPVSKLPMTTPATLSKFLQSPTLLNSTITSPVALLAISLDSSVPS